MGELGGIIERAKVENILSFLKYGTGSFTENEEKNERKIEQSFDIFMMELKEILPGIDEQDEELFAIAARLASVHDDVYFSLGVVAGFQLYKNLEREYETSHSSDLQELLERAITLA